MVKDSSKKLKGKKEAEKVDEVIVKKVEETKPDVTSETPLEDKKEPSKMPEGEIEKPKKAKKSTKKVSKKLIKTGKEDQSSALSDESEKVAKGNSMGLIFGITIAVAIVAGVSYYAYTKLFKKKKEEIKEIPQDQIKSISEVKKIET